MKNVILFFFLGVIGLYNLAIAENEAIYDIFSEHQTVYSEAVESDQYTNVIVLSKSGSDVTITYDQVALLYGSQEINYVTLESGANVELIHFPGNNIITIQSNSDLFLVSRSGACVIIEGTDGTTLKIPATRSTQKIIFNDVTLNLVVSNNQVILGSQIITLIDSDIEYKVEEFQNVPLQNDITTVQPMTGIVFWADNDQSHTDAIQLEFSYVLYNQVVTDSGIYDWTDIDNLLDGIAGRHHQAILRFYFVYPGEETSVPDYIKNLPDYHETKGLSEGLETWFPDWTNAELQRFVLEFYTKFGEKYDNDPRLAFLQTGFGLWAEYHIYDGPFELGTTFPSKAFQSDFFIHLDAVLNNIPWSVSIDAADETYSPFSQDPELLDIHFGLFDDSFMHETHSEVNEINWEFFDLERSLMSPAGGEFSYYSDFDQQNVLNEAGIYGIIYEEAAAQFHISYMFGNDQPDYQTMERIQAAGLASGYKFEIISFKASPDASIVEIKNSGIAPFYYDAFVAINGIRSTESLKGLAPGETLVCNIASGGTDPILTIESDHLLQGQNIGYKANLNVPELSW